MKQVKLLWYALLVMVALVSCNSSKTSDEILDECGSGVVLIMNQYYYKVTLPTGKVWYFTGFDEDGDMKNWTMDITEIQKNKNAITGTGFFISKDGKVLTNRHVAAPTITLSDTKHSVKSLLETMAEMVNQEMQQMSERYDELEAAKSECYSYDECDGNYYVDNEKLQGIKAQITSGTISQKSDNNKIMYTIPSLPGSSGSPVVNEYGKLVAVNFAGMTGTQSFNYGIRVNKVRQFVENQ